MNDLVIAALGFTSVTTMASLGWLIRWAWGHTHKRIDDAWEAIDGKAPNMELARVRDTQKDIFETFSTHDRDDKERHAQVVQQLGRVEGKVDALLGRRRGVEDDGG